MQLSIDLSLTGTVTLNGVAVLPRTYQQKVLALGAVAYWPMTETSGTAGADATGNGYTGTYGRDVSTMGTVAGPVAGETAPTFDGANDYLNVYSSALATALGNLTVGTVAAWCKVSAAGDWTDGLERRVFSVYSSGYVDQLYMRNDPSNNLFRFLYGGNSDIDSETTSLSTTDWFHAAMTFDYASLEMNSYVDGVALTPQDNFDAWSNVIIGILVGGNSLSVGLWKGAIAHAALWDRALSAAEVATLATV